EAPTIADLARGMSAGTWGQGQSAVPPIQRGKGVDHPPLSFAQRRLWFIDRLEPGSHAYNVPVAVRLQGRLDVAALQTALERIVSRHESLRTVISYADENLTQEILPKSEVKLTRVDLR